VTNQTTPRWVLGLPSSLAGGLADGLVGGLLSALRRLERTLSRLHGRIEYPAPSSGARVDSSANVTINSTTDTVITSATVTFTPDADCFVEVTATFTALIATFGALGDYMQGRLFVDGVLFGTHSARLYAAAAGDGRVTTTSWSVPLLGGRSHTLALYARQGNGTSTYTVLFPPTGFTYIVVPNPYKYPS
jgi:hypothetical protein